MFNYFYVAEYSLDVDSNLGKTLVPSIKSGKFKDLELTSRIFYSEKECTETIVRDMDELKESLVKLDSRYIITEFYAEAFTNPQVLKALGKPVPETTMDEEAEEAAFWTENKLVVFVMFEHNEAENFLCRFTIYGYDDEISLSSLNPALYQPNFSTIIN